MHFSFPDGNAVRINCPDSASLLSQVRTRLSRGQGFALATINVDHLQRLAEDATFRRAYAAQDLVCADGNPIVWLSRLAGSPVQLAPGSDLVLPLAAEAAGQTDRAFEGLLDARTRTNRLADPYVWLDVHILDALCELGRRHGRPETGQWAETMRDLASRTGMRELTARAMLHAAALGSPGDADAAALLAADIDNPELRVLVAAG